MRFLDILFSLLGLVIFLPLFFLIFIIGLFDTGSPLFIQKRVGLKRMLAIGIFAFAVKKKVKEELSYIIIEWSDGKFDHETVFEFEGKGSVTQANELRNKLINEIG